MYKHSTISKSLSNLFGHGAQHASYNNENKSETDIATMKQQEQPPSKNLVEQVNDSRFLKRKGSFRANSGAKVKSVQKSKEDENVQYLNDLYTSFGGNQQDVNHRLLDLSTNNKPTTLETILKDYASDSSSSIGSVGQSDETHNLILAAGKISLDQIPDLSENSKPYSTHLKMRERISNVFGRSRSCSPERKVIVDEGATTMIKEHKLLFQKSETLLVPKQRIVKKKSSLKFTNTSFQMLEKDILQSNPALEGFQLFNLIDTSSGSTKTRIISSPHSHLPFSWSGWKQGIYGLDTFLNIETKSDANNFIYNSRDLLFEQDSEIHIMRKNLTPERFCKELNLAGQLQVFVSFDDDRRFTVWNFLIHIVLSDLLYQKDNVHEPIVGVSWHGSPQDGVISLWLTRSHCEKNERELFEISRVCHYIRDCLPETVHNIMNAENLMYCVNETNECYKVEFVSNVY